MKNCSKIKEYLCDYIDGTLSKENVDIVQSHLSQCKTCKKEFEEMRILVHLCTNLQPVEPPENFNQQLLENISVRANQKHMGNNILSIFIKNNMIKAASIILAAGVLLYSSYLALFLGNNRNSKHENIDNVNQVKMFSYTEDETQQQQIAQDNGNNARFGVSAEQKQADSKETRVTINADNIKDAEKFEKVIIKIVNTNKYKLAEDYQKDEFSGESYKLYKSFFVSFTTVDEKLSFLSQLKQSIGEDSVDVIDDNESLSIILSIRLATK